MSTPKLRRRLKAHYEVCDHIFREWEAGGSQYPPPLPPPFPDECRGMLCGAKTRAGTPCKQKVIYGNGRCKFHGGLSTGPKTEEGKRRSSQNGFQPKNTKFMK